MIKSVIEPSMSAKVSCTVKSCRKKRGYVGGIYQGLTINNPRLEVTQCHPGRIKYVLISCLNNGFRSNEVLSNQTKAI